MTHNYKKIRKNRVDKVIRDHIFVIKPAVLKIFRVLLLRCFHMNTSLHPAHSCSWPAYDVLTRNKSKTRPLLVKMYSRVFLLFTLFHQYISVFVYIKSLLFRWLTSTVKTALSTADSLLQWPGSQRPWGHILLSYFANIQAYWFATEDQCYKFI